MKRTNTEDYEIEVTVRLTVPYSCNTCFADPNDIARDVARAIYAETGSTSTREGFDEKPEYLSQCIWGRIVSFATQDGDR